MHGASDSRDLALYGNSHEIGQNKNRPVTPKVDLKTQYNQNLFRSFE
jgi:hypothetical protein